MLGKTNAVSGGKQKYGAYNIEEVEVDGGVVLEITDADEKPVDMLQAKVDATTSCAYLFYYYGATELPDISKLDTSNVTDMYSMFSNTIAVTTMDLTNFDTKKVVNMNYMFQNCQNLNHLDISSFDTSKVISMISMFYYNRTLQDLKLGKFSTSMVSDTRNMFGWCGALKTIPCVLDLYSATNVASMFYKTTSLTGATLKNIRISLQIGSGTSYGHLWELPYLINAVKELWDLTGSTQQTLTIGSANLEKIANVYVKLVDVTDEMTAQDPYAANKLPCVECESTDEGAMTLTAYAGLKNWVLA